MAVANPGSGKMYEKNTFELRRFQLQFTAFRSDRQVYFGSHKMERNCGRLHCNFRFKFKCKKGSEKNLPTLKASVNAFTRMWYGIMPATSLVYSDGIEAPEKLLKKLDKVFILPEAHVDWGF